MRRFFLASLVAANLRHQVQPFPLVTFMLPNPHHGKCIKSKTES